MTALDHLVALSPGQGAYAPDWATRQSGLRATVIDVAATVDAVATDYGLAPVSSILLAPNPPSLSHLLATQPDELQFAVYTLSVASGQVLLANAEVDLFLGHSLGELAALQLAGAYNVATGARILGERVRALRAEAPADTGMAAVSAGVDWVRSALGLLGRPLELAVLNGDHQQVISGPADDLARFADLAKAARVAVTPLSSPYGFHHQALAGARIPFARALAALPIGTPQRPTYSPILRRRYRAGDDVGALLALHLTTPVDFAGSVTDLVAAGYRSFVELSASTMLTKLVKRSVPTAYAVSLIDPNGVHSAEEVLAGLATAATDQATLGATAAAPAPVAAPEVAAPEVAAPPVAAPAPVAAAASPTLSPASVAARVQAIYAEALEYPAEVFTDDVELEADLGVDSVKQTELIGRLREEFAMPAPPEDFRMASVARFGQVVDLVISSAGTVAAPSTPETADKTADETAPTAAPTTAPQIATPGHGDREGIAARIQAIYAEALEYPAEVFTDDVELEADLGVDSVKQTELIGRLREEFAMPAPPEDFRMASVARFGQVVDLVAGQSQRQLVGV